jgi:transcriptional regulator GlxA family with amidase domain
MPIEIVSEDPRRVSRAARRIGFVVFDGLTMLDFVGPFEVFAMANAIGKASIYELVIVASSRDPITADSGVALLPHEAFEESAPFDTIVTPGGPGLRVPAMNKRVAEWLKAQAPQTRRMVSVCTGLFGLAATGLLDGHRAATHWHHAFDAAQQFPRVNIDASVLYLEDPPFFTSAGITAGVDLALALVEKDHGPALSLAVARMLVVYLKRPGGQLQFSESLRFQTRAKDKFAELAAWLPEHLADDLSVESLARRTNMSLRHFARSFKSTFGASAGHYVEQLRLEAARDRLGAPNQTIESISFSVGFRSADVFRRAFERRFGITPSMYERHFGTRS